MKDKKCKNCHTYSECEHFRKMLNCILNVYGLEVVATGKEIEKMKKIIEIEPSLAHKMFPKIFNVAGYCNNCEWHPMSDEGCEQCKPYKEKWRKEFWKKDD